APAGLDVKVGGPRRGPGSRPDPSAGEAPSIAFIMPGLAVRSPMKSSGRARRRSGALRSREGRLRRDPGGRRARLPAVTGEDLLVDVLPFHRERVGLEAGRADASGRPQGGGSP